MTTSYVPHGSWLRTLEAGGSQMLGGAEEAHVAICDVPWHSGYILEAHQQSSILHRTFFVIWRYLVAWLVHVTPS